MRSIVLIVLLYSTFCIAFPHCLSTCTLFIVYFQHVLLHSTIHPQFSIIVFFSPTIPSHLRWEFHDIFPTFFILIVGVIQYSTWISLHCLYLRFCFSFFLQKEASWSRGSQVEVVHESPRHIMYRVVPSMQSATIYLHRHQDGRFGHSGYCEIDVSVPI